MSRQTPPQNAKGEEPSLPALETRVLVSSLATLSGSSRHDATDLREDRADRRRNARHNRTGSNGHETSHQSVLDEVLTACIFHHFQLQQKVLHSPMGSPLPISAAELSAAMRTVSPGGIS
jgi:hypothetical protein